MVVPALVRVYGGLALFKELRASVTHGRHCGEEAGGCHARGAASCRETEQVLHDYEEGVFVDS